MNKNRFRVLFNKCRGVIMAVPEIASHCHQASSPKQLSPSAVDTEAQSLCLANIRPIAFAMLVISGQVAMLPMANANGIVVDAAAPASQQPMITNTASGITQVNIQTPSAAGVSHNTYSQFDVSQQGVILNNSRTNVQTQLAGFVQGNPNLAAGTARVILNEVNSSNPSLLNGYIEVAGSRAQVVIANPAGISCDGCGFINANRATLTTGTPILNSGNLLGYRVGGGTINFLGAGLDSTQTNFTDVIARAVQVNAGLFANALNVVTGTNQVNLDSSGNPTTVTTITPNTGSTAPSFAIDVAALGGMYAGKIHLVGTEAGLGVSNAGDIGAAVGEITVGLDGVLHNTGKMRSKTDLTVNSAGMDGSGSLTADNNIAITLTTDYDNVGSLQAGNNLTLQTTGNFTNHSILIASNHLELNAQNVDNTLAGEISAFVTQLSVSGTLTNHGLIDGSDTFIQAGKLANSGIIFGDHLALSGNELTNTSGGVIAARNKLDIGVSDIENRSNSLLFSAGDLNIGGALDGDHLVIVSATSLLNEHATIEALGNVSIASIQTQNLNAGLETELVIDESQLIQEIQPEGRPRRYDITFFPTINNFNIELQSQVNASGQVVDQFEDYFYFQYTATTYSTHLISSLPGQILSGGDMSITGNLTNSDSRIIAGGVLDVSGATVSNLETPGQQITSYSGFQQFRDWDGDDEELEFGGQTPFNPASSITSINLAATQLASNITPTGTGTVVVGLSAPLPGNSLFQPNPDATANYLIETDPRFANYRTWLSSDYMLSQLSFDGDITLKRLGDGFYEQRLIREQINQLTGRRFLTGYANDETQYQALMNAGITVANSLQLTPGIALSAAQVAQLTSDIVWLVQQEVTMADGSKVMALVPQVYVTMQPSDLTPGTGMMTGNIVQMNISGDINNSGTIAGRALVNLNADNVNILGGRVDGDMNTVMATNDINFQGGTLSARDALIVKAGHDLNVASTTQSSSNSAGLSNFSRTNIDRVAGLYTSNPDAILVASAGNDVNLMAAAIQNQGANTNGNGITQISAGNNLTLGTVKVAEQNNSIRDNKNLNKSGSTQEIGRVINTNGDVILTAGKDITAKAASVNSSAGQLDVVAGGNIAIVNGIDTYNSDAGNKSKRSGTLSSRTKVQRDTFNQETATGSNLSAEAITLQAGQAGSPKDAGNISVIGSNIVSTNGTSLEAANNINIVSAETRNSERHEQSTKKTGLSSNGASISYGTSQLDVNKTMNSTSNTASTVGSTDGNVVIQTGKTYSQTGSDVLAPKGDIDITAQKVDINAAYNTSNSVTETKFKQTGITLAISNPVVNAIQTTEQMHQAANQTSDGRMQALAAGTTALAAKNAYDVVNTAQSLPSIGNTAMDAANQVGGINVSLSVGASKSSSHSTQTSSTAQGSNVIAGGSIHIAATGAGAASDINVTGSHIKAEDDATLKADNQINLLAAQNIDTLTSKNKSSSASIGMSVGTNGMAITGSLSKGKGKTNGTDTFWTETIVQGGNNPGNKVTLESGTDTNLIGAQVRGNQVAANVGTTGIGSLNIQSLQDTSTYHSQQKSAGVSVSIPIFGGTNYGGSINGSTSTIKSNFASTKEQSGIYAGSGGFQGNVVGNTKLQGAVIASTEQAIQDQKNSLITQTITVSDINNKAEYEANGLSAKVGGGLQGGLPQLSGVGYGEDRDKSDSVTLSAISLGVIISDESKQQKLTGKDALTTVALLNRDVHVNERGNAVDSTGNSTAASITTIFDPENVTKNIQTQVQITQAFSEQQHQLSIELNKKVDTAKAEKDAVANMLKNQDLTDEQRTDLIVRGLSAQREIEQLENLAIVFSAISTGLSAPTNSIGGIIANTLAPVASNQIGQYFKEHGTEGSAPHILAHGVLASAVAALGSNNPMGAALSAMSGELIAPLVADLLYGKPSEELNAEQKATVSTIARIGGVAASVGIDNGTSNLAQANLAAQNAVDNNWGMVGHYSTMATVLYLAGFSPKDAKAVALAAWGPDTDKRNAVTIPNAYKGADPSQPQIDTHLLNGKKDPLEVIAEQQALAVQLRSVLLTIKQYENDPTTKAMYLSQPEVQKILHAFGDAFAHVQLDGTRYIPRRGHTVDSINGHDPDNPITNADAYKNYVNTLFGVASQVSTIPRVSNSAITNMANNVSKYEYGQLITLYGAIGSVTKKEATSMVRSPVPECGFFQNCQNLGVGSQVNPVIQQIYGPTNSKFNK